MTKFKVNKSDEIPNKNQNKSEDSLTIEEYYIDEISNEELDEDIIEIEGEILFNNEFIYLGIPLDFDNWFFLLR